MIGTTKTQDTSNLGITFSSTDHRCDHPAERERIEKHSMARIGKLWIEGSFDGPDRVFKGTLPVPGIVCSRGLGDTMAHSIGILTAPETTIHTLQESSFLVLCSDGVSDPLGDQVLSLIREKTNNLFTQESLDQATKGTVQASLVDDPDDDNATIICVAIQTDKQS